MYRRISLPLTIALMAIPALAADSSTQVFRATLDNGLRVVIVRDPLAPVATLKRIIWLAAQERRGFPGMAHAQEHMAFRGCKGLTGDQIAAIYAQLGGSSNADTQQNITQYFVTVPRRIWNWLCASIRPACRISRIPRISGLKNGAPSNRKSRAIFPTPPTNSLPV